MASKKQKTTKNSANFDEDNNGKDKLSKETEYSEDQQNNLPITGVKPNYVVGIGASAGGLEALEDLFMYMPCNTGMAYIIVQHLSPDYKSMMDELLARKTMIPIKVAEDQMAIEADIIYLLPPKKEMIAANGRLYLTEREDKEVVNLPINTFFRSMAETYQEKSIAIVLSGTGSDGSKGVIQVHDSGGFVIAQSSESCKFDSMPKNAMTTNKVDLVVAPELMPDALVKYSKRTAKVEEQMRIGNFDPEVSEFSEILILLNNRFDLDFSQYKPSTITRRLERRVSYQKSNSLKDYINVLLSDQQELESLYYDLLIGVTQFFRDPVAFESLKSLLPKLLEYFKAEPEIRIWVSACASGQEAYTLSMMMVDLMAKDPHGNKPFKIFATDIHNKSIQYAAAGIYDEDSLQGVSDDYKSRFFNLLSTGEYQVSPEIRKPIIFAQHNLLKDPPFTRTHLVTCRNLLIYFNTTAQQRVLSLLSFSLMHQGLLFIGPSEAIGSHSTDFEMIDTINRLFRKTRSAGKHVNLPLAVRSMPQHSSQLRLPESSTPAISVKSKKAQETLLQQYVPASVLIDEKGNILHTFGDAGKFLTFSFGAASLNITALVAEEAKQILNQMLLRIGRSYKPTKTIGIKGFGHYKAVDIEMRVLSEAPGDLDYIIVSFSESKEVSTTPRNDELIAPDLMPIGGDKYPYASQRIKELEEELVYTQENLQVTVEELETSNEELQASNEELMASNEELQSTNEELQSVNEELFTVNSEFQQKEVEREELRSDEQSAIEEANLGILFLDDNLRVRKFSPLAAKLFHLIEGDYNRPFSAVSGTLMQHIQQDVYNVFDQGALIEKEVVDENDMVYLVRINAYKPFVRSKQGSEQNSEQETEIARHGVVITCSNITKMRASQTALEQTQVRFNNTLDAIADAYFEWELETNSIFFSEETYQKLGYFEERPNMEQLLGENFSEVKAMLKRAAKDKAKLEEIIPFVCADGSEKWMLCKGEQSVDESSKQRKLVGILIDFSKQKENVNNLEQKATELERSNQLLEKFAYIVSHDMKAPIRHIQNYLTFLEQAIKNNDAEAIQSEVQGIKDSTSGLTELVDDIITYARVTSEKKQLTKVDLNSLIKGILNTLAPEIKEKNIQIKVDEFKEITGDATLLTHLMQNLIGNACKYNDKAEPCIAITHAINKNNYMITVTDNGIGFDVKQADKIFEPFRRLVTKNDFEGSGIGLSICKTVVEQHSGTIEVSSEVGKGSSFVISIPL